MLPGRGNQPHLEASYLAFFSSETYSIFRYPVLYGRSPTCVDTRGAVGFRMLGRVIETWSPLPVAPLEVWGVPVLLRDGKGIATILPASGCAASPDGRDELLDRRLRACHAMGTLSHWELAAPAEVRLALSCQAHARRRHLGTSVSPSHAVSRSLAPRPLRSTQRLGSPRLTSAHRGSPRLTAMPAR